MEERKPRILVAVPIAESKLYCWSEFVDALRAQDYAGPWDCCVVDNTDVPSKGYVDWLRQWAKSQPFGPDHKVRLKRFGTDVDGTIFANPLVKVAVAERELWERFAGWRSYDYLLSLECDVLMPPDCIRRLYEADLPWAAAWMLSRTLPDPYNPGETRHIPLLWHGLDLHAWKTIKDWKELISKGYMEPPSWTEPFPCCVTHLGCTLIRGDVVRSVPFRLTAQGGDTTYSWDCAEAGFQPMCVPVACDHIASDERPNAVPPYQLTEVGR